MHLLNKVFKGKYLSLAAESKPHGLALQEDIWDADVDLHQKLLRRWKELKEHTGHKYACRHLAFSDRAALLNKLCRAAYLCGVTRCCQSLLKG